MPWRVKGKFLWIGEVGGFGKISFIALFYLYVNSGGRGILRARRRALTRHAGAIETNCGISRSRAKRIRRINLFKSSRSRCDFARTAARIMCLRRDGLRHWGYFARTHGANKCIYRQILNKK